ncbi:PIN-like domain-containing protein [Aestuariivirga litoralis]|uniref:PIN-like domain-containing protein n=1 Tax=Aestuariivirga litoralis TaxID=2650924 RepID=UPI0018C45FD6|nr:PIN-like domain-containing protein [Aestuariivirga litoralis]MBG1230929.1 hypothetical protein [Aestuariivirga litoralis]
MIEVFDRQLELPALPALISALSTAQTNRPFANAAIALDASAVLRIPGHKKSVGIIDYLNAQHQGPIILPGQVVQEFWNNQLNVIDTISKSLQKNFEAFMKDVERAGSETDPALISLKAGLDDFKDRNGALFHPDMIRRTEQFLEGLKSTAEVPFAPRQALHQSAEHRKKAKTPPGFKDPGDGDFYVWADLLFGLLKLKANRRNFDRLILITNDAKLDWCREGKPHPVLFAEARALLEVDFDIWTLDKFANGVAA